MPSDRPAAPVSSTYWSHFLNLRCHLLDFDVSVRNNGQTQENQSKWAGSAASCRSAGQSWLIKSKQQPHPSAWRPTADQLCVCVCVRCFLFAGLIPRQFGIMLNDKPKSLNLQLETDTHADEGASFTNQCWRCLCVGAVCVSAPCYLPPLLMFFCL